VPPHALLGLADSLHAEIKIIGFQDEKVLRFDQNIKHAVFIYPDETVSINA
jgi:hypothetical protein